jgi:hypothetical protein
MSSPVAGLPQLAVKSRVFLNDRAFVCDCSVGSDDDTMFDKLGRSCAEFSEHAGMSHCTSSTEHMCESPCVSLVTTRTPAASM